MEFGLRMTCIVDHPVSMLDCELALLFVAQITLRPIASFTRNNSKGVTVRLVVKNLV